MIVRVFRAKIRAGKLEEWQEEAEQAAVPWLESKRGMLGYYLGKPIDGDAGECCIVSLWQNVDALREAVGEDWTQAVVLEEEEPLVEEVTVHHYEVFGASEPAE